ncbi:glycosyltransferase family 2 protein [Candidatus Shapirobacteria bacterium]|nr:glycosyltransferase family 2 protein [Candidatus Shapirobacteria bacterium]
MVKRKNSLGKIALLIPAFNEEKYITQVIKNCASYRLPMVVINDGSLDQTAQVVGKLIKRGKYPLILLHHNQNKGKGAALNTGFKYAMSKNYQGVITLDADAQHDAKEIKKFLQMIKQEKPDLIIGSRFDNTHNMPFLRLATNYFTSWIISKLAGQRVEDVQSGFRYISSKIIKNIELKTKNFETEPELILKACWLNYKVKNLPITTIYHPDFVSEVNKLTDTFKFFRLAFKSLVWRRKFI